MKGTPSIYFLCPDTDIPSGGINRVYRIANVTHEGGYHACVLHQREGFRNRWSPVCPPIRYWEKGLQLESGDVVVIPETEPGAMRQLSPGLRKVVLALNWSYIFENLPMGHRWSEYGICQVLTPSRVIEDFVRWATDLPVYRISVPVDHHLFSYSPRDKDRLILYMAHRNRHGEWIEKIFRQLPRPLPPWQWQGVQDLPHGDYAALMRKAGVFVATGLREGVPGPILEAMAAGALVVGYGGVGGNEYLIPEGRRQNAFQVENEDYSSLCKVLEKALSMMEACDPLIDQVRQNAMETVRPLTFESERDSVLTFWERFLGTAASGSTETGREPQNMRMNFGF